MQSQSVQRFIQCNDAFFCCQLDEESSDFVLFLGHQSFCNTKFYLVFKWIKPFYSYKWGGKRCITHVELRKKILSPRTTTTDLLMKLASKWSLVYSVVNITLSYLSLFQSAYWQRNHYNILTILRIRTRTEFLFKQLFSYFIIIKLYLVYLTSFVLWESYRLNSVQS